jgi:elongation factor G
MKSYSTSNIRNIAIIGHQGSGKTTLAEALLYVSHAIEKQGEVDKKTTVSDYMIEEHIKGSSVSLSLLPVEFQDHKFNFLDLPGSDEFIGDLSQALHVVKGAVIVIDATKGVEVGTVRVWKEIRKRHIPAILFINKMDKDNIKFEQVLENIREKLGKRAVPFCWPIGKQDNFEGFVNITTMKARIYDGLTSQDAEIWEEKKPKVEELRQMMLESVAETSDTLLEKFFNGETLTDEEVKYGLHEGVIHGELTPVLVGSASKAIGVRTLLTMLFDYLPAPNELEPLKAYQQNNVEVTVRTLETEPFQGYVFKTTVDPFLGNIHYIKINAGQLKLGQEVFVSQTLETKKMTNVFTLRGKQNISNDIFYAGDICVIAKIEGIQTGYTLSDPKHPLIFKTIDTIYPVMYIAIHPKLKQDEDKISHALHRLNIEDPTFEIVRNKETNQLLLGGQGMTHLQYVMDRLKTMFKVDVDIEDQKIVYRETIKARVDAEGKHKKQSGGAGQFGHVFITFEPSEKLFEFEEKVVGGSVPKNYFPAVEKGLLETFEHGPLAGFPVINIKATLYDGSYHAVDSNELSFKLAAGLAFRQAIEKAQPTILEPIVRLGVLVQEQFVGEVMGDMNKRRGRVMGMEASEDMSQYIQFEVPESEIISYAIDLKAMTQGSGQFSRSFLRYDEVPHTHIPKIIQAYKK